MATSEAGTRGSGPEELQSSDSLNCRQRAAAVARWPGRRRVRAASGPYLRRKLPQSGAFPRRRYRQFRQGVVTQGQTFSAPGRRALSAAGPVSLRPGFSNRTPLDGRVSPPLNSWQFRQGVVTQGRTFSDPGGTGAVGGGSGQPPTRILAENPLGGARSPAAHPPEIPGSFGKGLETQGWAFSDPEKRALSAARPASLRPGFSQEIP